MYRSLLYFGNSEAASKNRNFICEGFVALRPGLEIINYFFLFRVSRTWGGGGGCGWYDINVPPAGIAGTTFFLTGINLYPRASWWVLRGHQACGRVIPGGLPSWGYPDYPRWYIYITHGSAARVIDSLAGSNIGMSLVVNPVHIR